MASTDYREINLHLQDINHLFLDPELNPFENQRLQPSGVEEAANHLRAKPGQNRIMLNIFLPKEQITPDLESKIRDALARYCDFKMEENRRQLEIEHAAGWRSVRIGLIFSAICALMVVGIYLLGPFSETLGVVFVGVFTILVWMAIWNPAELFLYGLRPYKLDIEVFKALKEAEIVVKAETKT
ncbi:MAG TPA: hypothetical protein VLB04_07700 [Methanotrichaceae archaeon]|nr:hypothetical protein [Methanotrichaceae archaeon]